MLGIRVLFITSAYQNYQEDVLYDGLCHLLGPENVVDYPSKDVFHGRGSGHPAMPRDRLLFHHPDHPLTFDQIVSQTDRFDAVVVGSIRPFCLDVWRQIQHLFQRQPIAWLHGEDHRHPWPPGIRFTHRFLREMLPGDTDVFPLPFGVPPAMMQVDECPRDIDVSFVMTTQIREFRRIYGERLAREGFAVHMDQNLPRSQYIRILRRSRISVSLRGVGYDTFRYWEIPYLGTLLLSERLPIVIPDNFVHGESAVFFSTPEEMAAQVHFLLAHPQHLDRIAAKGKALAQASHTSVARARSVLQRLGFGV